MKKIFIAIILLIFATNHTNAQIDNDIEPSNFFVSASIFVGDNAMASNTFSYPWMCKTHIFNAGVGFRYYITDYIAQKFTGNLSFGFAGGDIKALITTTTSTEFYVSNHVYWHIDLLPLTSIHGNGVQTNGDYLDFWFHIATGIGFKYDLDIHNRICADFGISRGFDVVSHFNNKHDDVFMFAIIGYQYFL